MKVIAILSTVLFSYVAVAALSACGSEAKFHSVYNTAPMPPERIATEVEPNDRHVYVCDYEPVNSSPQTKYAYVCREITTCEGVFNLE